MTGCDQYYDRTRWTGYWDVIRQTAVTYYPMTTTASTEGWIEPLRNISELERFDRMVKSQLKTRELGRVKEILPINTKGFCKLQYFNKAIR